jgi:hypothetical protein
MIRNPEHRFFFFAGCICDDRARGEVRENRRARWPFPSGRSRIAVAHSNQYMGM